VYDTPFSAAENQRASISLHKEAMQGFRELLIAKFASENSPNLPKKIFLVRKGNRREYNQSDAIELASDFGIVPVFVENLTLEEKIRLFLQSELIIGPEGSGFANTLFTTPNTRLLTWWPDKLGPGANYNPNLASVSGATYYFTPSSWCQKTPGEETYILNLSLLKSALEVLSQEPL
jgi:capsular polysaccharide biosynthesis protein